MTELEEHNIELRAENKNLSEQILAQKAQIEQQAFDHATDMKKLVEEHEEKTKEKDRIFNEREA